MKQIIALIRRIGLWLAIFALDIQIDGTAKAMELVRCPLTLGRMEIARHVARTERTRLRGQYNATFPVGKRRTWSMA